MYGKDLHPTQYPWATAPENLVVGHTGKVIPMEVDPSVSFGCSLVKQNDFETHPLDKFLKRVSTVSMEDRIPVIGIGSNSSPAVLYNKIRNFGSFGADTVVPVFRANISNINVGFSGHFVSGGYIPAAPFHQEGNSLPVTVSFLSADQLDAIDATEPTYRRLRLSPDAYAVTLDNGEKLETAYIYASRFGVMQDNEGNPFALTTQEQFFLSLHNKQMGKGFFKGDCESVSLRIAGKGQWAKNRLRWNDVFESSCVFADGIEGTEMEPFQWSNNTKETNSSGFSGSFPDIDRMTEAEYLEFLETISDDEGLPESWLEEDFDISW